MSIWKAGMDLFIPPGRFDLDGINYAKKIFDLTEGLFRRNYSSQSIQLILGENFKRALSAVWVG